MWLHVVAGSFAPNNVRGSIPRGGMGFKMPRNSKEGNEDKVYVAVSLKRSGQNYSSAGIEMGGWVGKAEADQFQETLRSIITTKLATWGFA